jgi:hypothetical protein
MRGGSPACTAVSDESVWRPKLGKRLAQLLKNSSVKAWRRTLMERIVPKNSGEDYSKNQNVTRKCHSGQNRNIQRLQVVEKTRVLKSG